MYHYEESGLSNIYLLDGFSEYGESLDNAREAIVVYLDRQLRH